MNGGILTFLVTVLKSFAQCPGCLLNDNSKHSLAYASGYLFYRRSSLWLRDRPSQSRKSATLVTIDERQLDVPLGL